MHFTIPKSQRSFKAFKSSFKSHVTSKLQSLSKCSSENSSSESDKNKMSVETISSSSKKSSKREKFISFFCHSRPKQNSVTTCSSKSTKKNIVSKLPLDSQNQSCSQSQSKNQRASFVGPLNSIKEETVSMLPLNSQNQSCSQSQSKNQRASYAGPLNSIKEDAVPMRTLDPRKQSCSQSQSKNQHASFVGPLNSIKEDTVPMRTLDPRKQSCSQSQSKNQRASYAGPLNFIKENIVSMLPMSSQNLSQKENQNLGKSKHSKSYVSHPTSPQDVLSGASTAVNNNASSSDSACNKKQKSSKRAKIKAFFDWGRDYTKVYINPCPSIVSAPLKANKRKQSANTAVKSSHSSAVMTSQPANKPRKQQKLKKKSYIVGGLTSLASTTVVQNAVNSTSEIMAKCYKHLKKLVMCLRKKFTKSKPVVRKHHHHQKKSAKKLCRHGLPRHHAKNRKVPVKPEHSVSPQ
ncbi:hypothetical protein ACO0OE_003877 [Hanseniaspora uvarum]